MQIRMSDFGSSLCTRSSGRLVYSLIIDSLNDSKSNRIVFDFSGVDSVTNSFADEVFGRLVCELGMDTLKSRTTFVNVKVFPAKVIRMAMNNRDAKCLSFA